MVVAATKVMEARTKKSPLGSDNEAPRYNTAEMPKPAPAPTPYHRAGPGPECNRTRQPSGVDNNATPTKLTRIPVIAMGLILSPKITAANNAACTVSVLEYAVPTAKFRV